MLTNNLQIRIYINNIEKTISFKTKTGYYLELLTSKTMKLLERTANKINKIGENAPQLATTEIILVHCNIVNKNYQQNLTVLHAFFSK